MSIAKYNKLEILISSGFCVDLLDERAMVLVRANHRNGSYKYTNALEREEIGRVHVGQASQHSRLKRKRNATLLVKQGLTSVAQ